MSAILRTDGRSIFDALIAAYRAGDLDTARRLTARFGGSVVGTTVGQNVVLLAGGSAARVVLRQAHCKSCGPSLRTKQNMSEAFRYACVGGNLAVVKWLAGRFDLTATDACTVSTGLFAMPVLKATCVSHSVLPTTLASPRQMRAWQMTMRGHLEVAKWVAARFALIDEDARADSNYALWRACKNGHLALAQWLAATFSILREDIRQSCAVHGDTFQNAEVAAWLTI
jgi:hypothetical protein